MTDFAAILERPVRVRAGDPTPLQRLERKSTIDPDGCWTWNGCVNSKGYACIGLNGVVVLAHRLSHFLHYGPIPDGLQVDHMCHNADKSCRGGNDCRHRRCWRPAHLEAVEPLENRRRSYRRPGPMFGPHLTAASPVYMAWARRTWPWFPDEWLEQMRPTAPTAATHP